MVLSRAEISQGGQVQEPRKVITQLRQRAVPQILFGRFHVHPFELRFHACESYAKSVTKGEPHREADPSKIYSGVTRYPAANSHSQLSTCRQKILDKIDDRLVNSGKSARRLTGQSEYRVGLVAHQPSYVSPELVGEDSLPFPFNNFQIPPSPGVLIALSFQQLTNCPSQPPISMPRVFSNIQIPFRVRSFFS